LNKVLLVHDLPRLFFFFFFVVHSGLVFFFPDWGEGEASLLSPLIPLSKISQAMEGLMIDGALTTESVFVFFGRNFAKFRPEKYGFDLHKGFQKWPKFARCPPKKKFQIARIL
jgi:hypothetical protein